MPKFKPSPLSLDQKTKLIAAMRLLAKETSAAADALEAGKKPPPTWMMRDFSAAFMSLRLITKAITSGKGSKHGNQSVSGGDARRARSRRTAGKGSK